MSSINHFNTGDYMKENFNMNINPGDVIKIDCGLSFPCRDMVVISNQIIVESNVIKILLIEVIIDNIHTTLEIMFNTLILSISMYLGRTLYFINRKSINDTSIYINNKYISIARLIDFIKYESEVNV